MVWLEGGPSQIDTYDMKPNAPVEIRGEFRPIRTNIPGMDICELLPLQATIANLSAIVACNGNSSQMSMPGMLVRIGRNSPRISTGAFGFMSYVSIWLGPPSSQTMMTA